MNRNASIAAELCYWALVPASDRPWTVERLRTALEPWVPSDVDRLDIAWGMSNDHRVLIVAVEPERLDGILAATPGLEALTPDRVPEHVQTPGVAAADLHFLVGQRQPAALRRIATCARWICISCTAATIVLLAIGAMIHTTTIDAAVQLRTRTAADAVAAALPTALAGNAEDPIERLDQAQRMLAGLARSVDGTGDGPATICARVLAAFPADLRVQIHTVNIDGQRLIFIGTAPDVAMAQATATAISTVVVESPGWRMLPLQAISAPGSTATTFTCSAQRDGGGG